MLLILVDCYLMLVRLFHLPMDKQILLKHVYGVVKYEVGQVMHGISTGLQLVNLGVQGFG